MFMGFNYELIGLAIKEPNSSPTLLLGSLKILVRCMEWDTVRKCESIFKVYFSV